MATPRTQMERARVLTALMLDAELDIAEGRMANDPERVLVAQGAKNGIKAAMQHIGISPRWQETVARRIRFEMYKSANPRLVVDRVLHGGWFED